MANTPDSFLIGFDLKVKFWITTCQKFEVLEGNYVIAKEHMIFDSSSCLAFDFFPVKMKRLNAHQL